MKCAAAVRIGCSRPGSSSLGLGRATFLNPNIRTLLKSLAAIYVETCAAGMACQITSVAWQRRLWPYLANRRCLLATQKNKQDAQKAEHAPAWRGEERDHNLVPEETTGIRLDNWLEFGQACRIDELPKRPHVRQKQLVAGDRLGAVIDQENESACQADQANEAEQATDHGCQTKESVLVARLPCGFLSFNRRKAGPPSLESARLHPLTSITPASRLCDGVPMPAKPPAGRSRPTFTDP